MWTPRLAVAPEQRVFIRLDENQRYRMVFFEMFQERWQFFELQPLACIYQQSSACEVSLARSVKLSKNRDQVHEKVINAVETHIFEGAENGAFAGAGQPGENDELARIPAGSGGRLHRRASQLLTRR